MRFILILTLFSQALFGQYFGQNKVQYNEFDWNFIVSPNFNIYYYGDNYETSKKSSVMSLKLPELSVNHIFL